MTPIKELENTVICGDALGILKTLPDESVQSVVTSPPYWGLRDYGTATWVGGDDGCDHKERELRNDIAEKWKGMEKTKGFQYKDTCKNCGAIRIDDQLGLEKTPEEYIANMVNVFSEVRRVLRDDGTLWLVIGDSYAASGGDTKAGFNERYFGKQFKTDKQTDTFKDANIQTKHPFKPKDLVGIPWMLAFALRADGWYLRQDIIWSKPNPMPESVTDRCTKSHEYIFLMTKSAKYYYDHEAIMELAQPHKGVVLNNRESGTGKARGMSGQADRQGNFNNSESDKRNKRSVWSIPTQPYKHAHFACFPEKLVAECIKAGSKAGDIILDPFTGANTTGFVAQKLGRKYLGIELKPEYIEIGNKRLAQTEMEFRTTVKAAKGRVVRATYYEEESLG